MGTKARGGITLYNVKNGKDAEYHRLRPQSEKAVVGGDNSLYITLSYIIEHVNGAQVITEAGSAQGYHVTARMNNGVSIAMTNGAVNSGTYKLTDYSKAQNRPDYVIIELRDSADKVVDIRTVQIIMEASSYVDIVADLRTTVSQHGDSISTIKQTADSISLKVDGIKNGVKNLIKGGQLNRTISRAFAMVNDGELTVKLKPETDYTLTVNGRISSSAWDKRQMLRTYIFDKSWKGFMVDCDIQATSDTTNSVTFRIPKDKASVDNTYCFNCYSFPNQLPQGKNGEVTVNWITLTEGTQPEKAWIPAEGEDVYTQMSKAGMEIKDGEITLTADRTKIRNNKGEDIAVFNEDGTVDARRILMRCRFGNITFGEVDGYPNIILTNELGQPQIMLNHRGIVNKYGVDMELINASRYFVSKRDGNAYLGVNIIVKITNRGFQQNTYGGGDIELTATLNDNSYERVTLQLGKQYTGDDKAIVAATTPITLKIGESGELIYGGLFEIGSTSGGAVVAQKMSYSVRSVYYDTVVTKSYVSELGGNNFSSDSGGNLINPSNGDEPPAVIPAPNMDV